MPTVEDVSRVLTDMTPEKYIAAVSYIYYLAEKPLSPTADSSVTNNTTKELQRKRQIEFVKRTAGKIQVDEEAIEELRMRSMI